MPNENQIARDAYVWAEVVDRVLDWEAADIAQRQRAESIALLTLSAAPPPDALRELSALTNGIMAEALKRVADSLEKRPPKRDEDEARR